MSCGEINLTFNIIDFRFNVTVNIIISSNVFTVSTFCGFLDNVPKNDNGKNVLKLMVITHRALNKYCVDHTK